MANVADAMRAAPLSRTPSRRLLFPFATLAAAWFLLRVVDIASVAQLQNFVLVAGSLLVGAIPLVVLGSIASAAIAVFVPTSVFAKLALLPRPLQLPVAGMAAFAFPVCECGSVPVARRLVEKGLAPSAAVTFMLAAPVLNPIVVVSTFVAYRGRDIVVPIVAGRIGLGLLAAMAVGWVIGARRPELLLKSKVCAPGCTKDHDHVVPADDGPSHHHHHDHAAADTTAATGRTAQFFGHLVDDFLFMGKFLILGAGVAALLQTFLPQSWLGSLAGTPVLDLVALMGLAFVLSLCSESDAFVAASFVQFGVGAQLAFLVFGPMVDTKLAFLYSATFSKGFFRTVLLVVSSVTLAGCLWIEVLVG